MPAGKGNGYSIPYGKKGVQSLNTDIPVAVVDQAAVSCAGCAEDIIREAVQYPAAGPSLGEFLDGVKRLLVIVDDAARPTPTSRALSVLCPTICAVQDVRFLVASGAHRPPRKDELPVIFGPLLEDVGDSIFFHDCRNLEDLVSRGKTPRGTDVLVNRMLYDADAVVTIGSVEPHYFAGFTGGRKSIVPGIAGFATIEANHRWAMNARARALALDGNPVHEDMMDAMRFLGSLRLFTVQTVLGPGGVHSAFAGTLEAAHILACRESARLHSAPISSRADIVVTSAVHPLDATLYQAQKALENGRLALKDGGAIILVAQCPEGAGDDAFLRLLASGSTPSDVLSAIEKGYRLGHHKAAKIASLACDSRIFIVSSLPDETAKKAMMAPFATLQEAFDSAVSGSARPKKVILMPHGSSTVPVLKT